MFLKTSYIATFCFIATLSGCGRPSVDSQLQPRKVEAKEPLELIARELQLTSDDSKIRPAMEIYGPATVEPGKPCLFRILLRADEPEMETLGEGRITVEFTGADFVGTPTMTIYRREELKGKGEAAVGTLIATGINVVNVVIPASKVVRVAIGLGLVAANHGPELFEQLVLKQYGRRTVGQRVSAEWNNATVEGVSVLCIDAVVVFSHGVPPGISTRAEFETSARTANLSLPWLSLASAERRELRRHADVLQKALQSQEGLEAIAAVKAVLDGEVGERLRVSELLSNPNLSSEVRILCVRLLSVAADDDTNELLRRIASLDAEPSVQAAAAFATAGMGREDGALTDWINHYSKSEKARTLANLFVLLDGDSQKLQVFRAVISVKPDSEFDTLTWCFERIKGHYTKDRRLSEPLRVKMLRVATGLSKVPREQLINACAEIVTLQPKVHQLHVACFEAITDIDANAARGLIDQLWTEGRLSEQSLAIKLLMSLDDRRRSTLQTTIAKLVPDLLGSSESEQCQLLDWARTQDEYRDRLLHHIFEALVESQATSKQVHIALTSVGLEHEIPQRLLKTAQRPDASLSLRKDVLNHALGLKSAFARLVEIAETNLAECTLQSCYSLLGVPHADLSTEELFNVLNEIAFGDCDIKTRAKAIVAIAALGDSLKWTTYQSLVDQTSVVATLAEAAAVAARTELPDLREQMVAVLETYVVDAGQSLKHRLLAFRNVEQLSSSARTHHCFLTAFQEDTAREPLLANARFVAGLKNAHLRSRSVDILKRQLVGNGIGDEAEPPFAALLTLGEEELALQCLDRRLENSSLSQIKHVAGEFADLELEYSRAKKIIQDHIIQGRRLLKLMWVYSAVLLIVFCVLASFACVRTRDLKDFKETRRIVIESLTAAGLFLTLEACCLWMTSVVLSIDQTLRHCQALQLASLTVLFLYAACTCRAGWYLFTLWRGGRPWAGTLEEFVCKQQFMRDVVLQFATRRHQVFFVAGGRDSYDQSIPNPDLKSYQKDLAHWEKVLIPDWKKRVSEWEKKASKHEPNVPAAVGLGGVLAALGCIFLGPVGAIAGAGGLVALAGPAKPSMPEKPAKPPAHVKKRRMRPTAKCRVDFVRGNGKKVEAWLYKADVTIRCTSSVAFSMRADLLESGNFERESGGELNRTVSLELCEAASPSEFQVTIASPECGVLLVQNGRVPKNNQHAQKELIIKNVVELRIAGGAEWRNGQVGEVHLSGTRYFGGPE